MTTRKPQTDPDAAPGPLTLVGSCCLIFTTFVILSTAMDGGNPWPMPRSWYTHRTWWYLAAFVSFVTGCRLLRQPGSREMAGSAGWRPSEPGQRFHSFRFYTRAGCHLCDEAAELLNEYSPWLPDREDIDIDADPRLREEFNTCVPAVELDGKVRFRGRVNESLLRRLIEGTPVLERV